MYNVAAGVRRAGGRGQVDPGTPRDDGGHERGLDGVPVVAAQVEDVLARAQKARSDKAQPSVLQ